MQTDYFPTHLTIETSDYCNRRCSFCPGQRNRGEGPIRLLDWKVFESLLDELGAAPYPLKVSLQWIDEPLANPRFLDYLHCARQRSLPVTWLLQTNGDLLTAELLDALRHQLNAISVNFYSAGAFDQFLQRDLDYVPSHKPFQILPPGRLKAARGHAHRFSEAVVHLNRKFEHDQWIERHDRQQVANDQPCHRLWRQAAIGWDGLVYLCCRDNLKAHPVGDLTQQSLFAAYNSAPAQQLRALMQRGRRDRIAMCHHCPGAFRDRFFVLQPEQIAALRPARTPRAHRPDPAPAPSSVPRSIMGLATGQMPWGQYDYWSARAVARHLDHVCLPGFLPHRYEYVVGLTHELAELIRAAIRDALDPSLRGIWICGSRVVTRPHLFLLDPSVFSPPTPGPLEVGDKTHVREFGPDPRYSSDLDVKIFTDGEQLAREAAQRIERHLGERIRAASPHFPVSAYRKKPLLRVYPVCPNCRDARAAFREYNDGRWSRSGKGPLSLEYVQLLWDPSDPVDWLSADPTEPVRECLTPAAQTKRLPLSDLVGSIATLPTDPSPWRQRHGELSGHQLVTALIDFPALEPSDVEWDPRRQVIQSGILGAWAAQQAGRRQVGVVSEKT